MTNEEFYKAMCYLKAKYPNWNLDLTDSFLLSVWYEDFEKIEYMQMVQVCKDYCKANRFPPQSTYDILEVIPKAYSVEEAWEKVLGIKERCKSQEYFLSQVLKEEPSLYTFVKRFDWYDIEQDSYGNECIGYCIGKHFKRMYKEYLDMLTIAFVSGELKQKVLDKKEERLQIEV